MDSAQRVASIISRSAPTGGVTADDWPLPNTDFQSWYLGGSGNANTAAGDGLLSLQPPTEDRTDTFVYDPDDPIAFSLGIDCWSLAGNMGDRRAIEMRPDVLVYTSAPLGKPMKLTGPIKAVIHAASSATDTDFTVVLADVLPDGRSNLIQDGIIRTGFRDPGNAPQPIEANRVYAYEIDLWATSYLMIEGHRLRVEISSSDFNRYDRNPNTGLRFGDSPTTVNATQTVHHNPSHPSHIVLPVIS